MTSRLYVALGDSTGVGIGSAADGGYVDRLFRRLRASDPAWELVNLASNGATSRTARDAQAERAALLRPSLVTLLVGGNDVWRGSSVAAFNDNLRVIARALDRSGARVVAGDMVDLSKAPAADFADRMLGVSKRGIAEACAALGTAVHDVARAHGWSVVPLSQLPTKDEHFSGDGFHPSDAGYAALADAFWPNVARVALRG